MTRLRPSRASIWLLLAAALFMRALVPHGYMPERAAGGAIAVRLCNSDGVWLIPLEHGAKPGKDQQRAEQPCAFAGLGSPATPPPALPEIAPRLASNYAFAIDRAAAEIGATPRLMPPATGPPPTA